MVVMATVSAVEQMGLTANHLKSVFRQIGSEPTLTQQISLVIWYASRQGWVRYLHLHIISMLEKMWGIAGNFPSKGDANDLPLEERVTGTSRTAAQAMYDKFLEMVLLAQMLGPDGRAQVESLLRLAQEEEPNLGPIVF